MSSEHVGIGCDGDSEREDMPAETQALYDQLLADGAAWRAEQPVPFRLDDALATLTATPSAASPRPRAEEDTRVESSRRPAYTSHTSLSYPKGASHMRSSRLRGLIAGGAMAAVVALIAFLLVNLAAGRNSPPSSVSHGGKSNATLSSAPLVSVPAGRWVPQSRLDDTTNLGATGAPSIAPTDPRVVYEAVNVPGTTGGFNASLRRTDDGGATWHALTLPVPATDVNYVNLFVSPINAHTVWLQLSDQAATSCPTDESGMGDVNSGGQMHGGILASGSGFCGMEWYSSDAGQHWTPVKLSVPGLLSGTGLNSPGLVAQGSRLYATSGCVSRDCTRLLTSADGGATWQTADSGLLASSNNLCDFAPVPAGSALYAVTSAGDCSWLDTSPHTLWRSDDAGASWSRVETLPGQTERGLSVAQAAGSAQPVLYADIPTKTGTTKDKMGDVNPAWSDTATDLKYSTDGGKTWQAAPAAGAPAGLKPYWAPFAALSDGSVVWEFSQAGNDDPTGGSLYTWKPGANAWRLLAPATPSGFIDALTVVSSAGHGDQLWAVTRVIPNNSDPITYHVVAYQL